MLKKKVLAEIAATYILMYYNATSWALASCCALLPIAGTRIFSQKYQEIFLLAAILFEQ